MRNFGRALRLALRYRWTLAGSIGCALAVAVMWGGNIGTLYPVVEVVFKGQSLGQWVDEQIAAASSNVVGFEQRLNELRADPAPANDEALRRARREAAYLETRLEAEQAALGRYRWIAPYLHAWLPDDSFQTLALIIGLLVLGTILKDSFLILGSILVARLAQLSTFRLRNDFYRSTLRLDMARFGESPPSDLVARFTGDVGAIACGVEVFYGRALREPLKMIVCLAGAAYVCWRLLVLTLVVVPLALLLMNVLARSIKRASRRALEEMSLLYGVLGETFGAMKIVKAFTMERHERRRFHVGAKQFYRRAMKVACYDALVRPTTELMLILMISLAILVGAYLVLNDQTHLGVIRMSDRPLTLGSLLLFYAMLAGTSDPARKLADVFGSLQRAAAAADRVYEMLDREPRIAEPACPRPLRRHQEDLVFQDVHFHYAPAQPVLEGLSLRVSFGETLAIVGSNGCGKSTLASLVPRFFDPTAGAVLLDGIDLREVRCRDLRRQIGLVTQESLLFDDSIFNNIRYGAPHASREQVLAAARKAHADRFIEQQLAAGYETRVGPGGCRLSGGQRQRIALARAILRDPAILILDEATSQIDVESEQLIHKVLAEFIRGRTTLIITHRVSTLALADRILVMDAGRLVDLGTHGELQRRCELYSRLYHGELRQTA